MYFLCFPFPFYRQLFQPHPHCIIALNVHVATEKHHYVPSSLVLLHSSAASAPCLFHHRGWGKQKNTMFDVLKIKAPSTRVAEPHNTISALLKISLKISYQNLDSLLQIQDHIKTPTQEPLQLNAFVQPKCLFTHSISLRKPQH